MAKKNSKVDKRTSNIPVSKNNKKQAPAESNILTYKDGMTVADVAVGMGKTNAQIIMKLMQAGIVANQNQVIDRETIELVAMDFGYEVKDEVIVKKSNLIGGVFDLNATPDALPIMAVLGCYAQGDTHLVNVPQARLKECDRIACMTKELRKMGADIEELADGLIIHGGKTLHGTLVDSYEDHRIAMALSIAALGAEGVTSIKDGQCCQVTYPDFVEDFQKLGVSIKESVQK